MVIFSGRIKEKILLTYFKNSEIVSEKQENRNKMFHEKYLTNNIIIIQSCE